MKNIIVLIAILFSFTNANAEKLFYGLGHTFTDAFDKTGLTILAIGTGATLYAFSQDQATHDAWVNNQKMNSSFSGFGTNFWGTGIPSVLIAGGQLLWDEPNGIAHAESLIMSTAVSFALKYGTARNRPDSNTATSFPSGHTQVSFCTATNLAISYGWWVGIPAYGLGVLTGMARLSDNAHWLSDVVAGATIGILFGRSSFNHNMYVIPVSYDGGGYGIDLTYNL